MQWPREKRPERRHGKAGLLRGGSWLVVSRVIRVWGSFRVSRGSRV